MLSANSVLVIPLLALLLVGLLHGADAARSQARGSWSWSERSYRRLGSMGGSGSGMMGSGSMGGSGSTTVGSGSNDDEEDDDKGDDGCDGEDPTLGATGPNLEPEALCNIFQVFDNMGRGENSIGLNWPILCDDFESVDPYVCPDATEVAAICTHLNPQLNPAVKINYCTPLFEGSGVSDEAKCIQMCVNYVSKSRGNCCGFDCPP